MSYFEVKDIVALRGVLEGRRVSLRAFSADDITPTYLGWLQDPEIVRFSNQRFLTHTTETCQTYLNSFIGSFNHFLSIFDRDTKAMLGTMTVYHSVHHGTADIGIMVGDRRVWGQGIGADAFGLVMATLLDSEGIRKVTAGTMAGNISMIRIMERAGMQHEATRRAQELVEGVPMDVVYYTRFRHG
jgi:ribosomal-protein-alanine N-acetyltransferase